MREEIWAELVGGPYHGSVCEVQRQVDHDVLEHGIRFVGPLMPIDQTAHYRPTHLLAQRIGHSRTGWLFSFEGLVPRQAGDPDA